MEEGIVTMSKKELTRLEVVQRVEDRQMRQRDAAQALSISDPPYELFLSFAMQWGNCPCSLQ